MLQHKEFVSISVRIYVHASGVTLLSHLCSCLRCDLTFPTPKAAVLVDFQSPEAYASPEAAVCTR